MLAPIKPTLNHWALLLLLVLLWGSAFAAIEIALESFTPYLIVAGRLWLGAITLLGAMAFSGQRFPRSKSVWLWMLLMAFLGNALPFTLITWGQLAIDSNVAGMLMAFMPLMVIGLAHFLVPGEHITPTKFLGFGLGLFGVILLFGPEALLSFSADSRSVLAKLSILAGALCYAFNVIAAKRAPQSLPPLTYATGVTVLAALMMLPLAAIDVASLGPVSTASTVSLVLLGVLSTAIATLIYYKIVMTAGPSFLSLINYLVPAWAVIVGAVFLKETISMLSLIAVAIILIGVAIGQRRK